MPAQIDHTDPTIRVTVSAVADLAFCLFVVEKHAAGRGTWNQPWLAELLAQSPELATRVEGFWQDKGYFEWVELSFIADTAGVLFDDAEDINWPALRRAASGPVEIGELRTEDPEVRRVLEGRLARLRGEPALRDDYFRMLNDLWAFLGPYYRREGRDSAVRLAADIRAQLATTRDFESILPPSHLARLDKFRPMVAEAEREGRLVFVALGLSGVGSGLLEVPGGMVVSYSYETRKGPEQRREVATRIASQMKLLSDPTRVALLLQMVHGARSITDMARSEGLSQPTVSVHVKSLREAGLLEAQGGRGQKLYHAPPERVRALLQDVIDEVDANLESC